MRRPFALAFAFAGTGSAAFAAAPRPPRGLTPNSVHVPGDATLALIVASGLRSPRREDDR